MPQSEVQRLLAQIDAERTAAQQALHGMAVTAQHKFITTRMENMQRAADQLIKQLGPDKAIPLIARAMEGQP